MKVKMLIAMALAGLFSTTITFAATNMQKVDDASMSGDTSMQAPTATDNSAGSMQNQNMGAMTDNNNSSSPTAMPGPAPTGGDDMSADTATGDDDY